MKAIIFKVLVGVILISIFAASNLAAQQVATGPHDLTGPGPVDALGTQVAGNKDLCRYCHTPHNARIDADITHLWARSEPTNAGSFDMYTSTTMDTTNAAVTEPEGVSLACLSCHDGATAMDSLQGILDDPLLNVTPSNTLDDLALTNDAIFGTDLSGDHPISVSYSLAVTNGDMNGIGSISPLTLYAGDTATDNVECASCHDPHGDGADYFLRIPTLTGGLCETCHNK